MPSNSLWKTLTGWLTAERPHPHATASGSGANSNSPLAHKQLRAQRREQLFGLVRENMIRAGVLSSAYKFKVLTLDSLGQSFIVLMDVQGHAVQHDASTLANLEAQLQTMCRERLQLTVKTVYWRISAEAAQTAAPIPDRSVATAASRRQQAEAILTPKSPPAAPRPQASRPDTDFAPTQRLPPYPDDPDPLSDTQYGRLE